MILLLSMQLEYFHKISTMTISLVLNYVQFIAI